MRDFPKKVFMSPSPDVEQAREKMKVQLIDTIALWHENFNKWPAVLDAIDALIAAVRAQSQEEMAAVRSELGLEILRALEFGRMRGGWSQQQVIDEWMKR